jgi:predicted transcriptional regulator
MRCDLCNVDMFRLVGSYPFESKVLGDVSVPGLEYFQCQGCGDVLFSSVMAQKAYEYLELVEREAIGSLPVKEFISQTEAADVLGITKQAFSKNPRIKRGFIYFTKVGEKKLFYKKSVEEFSRTGDGRIKLQIHRQVDQKNPMIVFVNVPAYKPSRSPQWAVNAGKTAPGYSQYSSRRYN